MRLETNPFARMQIESNPNLSYGSNTVNLAVNSVLTVVWESERMRKRIRRLQCTWTSVPVPPRISGHFEIHTGLAKLATPMPRVRLPLDVQLSMENRPAGLVKCMCTIQCCGFDLLGLNQGGVCPMLWVWPIGFEPGRESVAVWNPQHKAICHGLERWTKCRLWLWQSYAWPKVN